MSSKIVLSQTVFDIGNLQRWQFALLMRVHWTFPDHSRVLHGCFTGASRVLHGCFTGVSRVFHGCFTGVSRVFHGSLTVQNQFFRSLTQFFESLTHSSHGSRVVHSWFTGDSRWFTGGSRMVHGCFTGVSRLVSGCWRTSFTGCGQLWRAIANNEIDTKSPETQPSGGMVCSYFLSDLSLKHSCALHQRNFGKS